MTTELPLVSVILPAYNAQATLQQAVHSVLSQDYPRLELLVVDDGSTDGTAQHPALHDPRVRVFSQTNAGPAAARNLGLAQAQGELIAFIDADDLWLPGKLRTQVAYLQSRPDISVVFGGFTRWEAQENGQFDLPRWEEPAGDPLALTQPSGWIYPDLLLDSVVHIITALVRREVFDAVGTFDTQLPTGEDYDFWLRTSRQFQIHQLARTVACYRVHPHSLTKVPRPENNELRVLQKALSSWGNTGPDGRQVDAASLKRRLFGICFGHGYFHFWYGSKTQAGKAFVQALGHDFWHPKVWVYWMLATIKRWLSS